MYKVLVPVVISTEQFNKEETLSELMRAGADGAFLTLYRCFAGNRIDTSSDIKKLSELVKYFRNAGLTVGVWVGESIGHGWGEKKEYAYRDFKSVTEAVGQASFCPADEEFKSDLCLWIKNIAQTEPDIILMDDDFRISNHGDGLPGCLCDWHVNEYNKNIGENLTADEIAKKVYCGGGSRYRDEWLKLQGETLKNLAAEIRRTVDGVNKNIRIGLCSGASSFDIDGITNLELAKIFAGNTKPFLRMAEGPYWCQEFIGLGHMITYERWMSYLAHCDESTEYEIVSEGDTYPRPRYYCPAAYLEAFDTALRADGGFDGILKYMIDYTSAPRYETGYIDKMLKNSELYKKTEEFFAGKQTVGFNMLCGNYVFRDCDFPGDSVAENARFIRRQIEGKRQMEFLNNLCFPTAFDSKENACIIFGESAKHIELSVLKQGAILDIRAAEILNQRGVDVGLESYAPINDTVVSEYYISQNEYVTVNADGMYEAVIKPEAEHITEYIGKSRHGGAYRYENSFGEKFIVYPVDAETAHQGFSKSYARQREINELSVWLQGHRIEAYLPGNPGLYMICKKNESKMTVGIWNLFPDEVDNPEIHLDKPYKTIKSFNCFAKLDVNCVKIAELAPFGFALFEVG